MLGLGLASHSSRQIDGTQRYLIVKRKEEIEVPIVEISAELMLQMEDTIGDIIL